MDIIFLNGASSSGKSCIAKILQNQLDENYLHIGIDTFVDMMPDKSNDWVGETITDGFYWHSTQLGNGETCFRISKGAYGEHINQAYYDTTLNLAKSGLKLIVDDVTNGNQELDVWRKMLSEFKVLYVGIKCNLKILQQREIERADRKNGTALEQFYRVHNGINYDLVIDTSKLSAQACAKMTIDYIDKTNDEA